MDDKRVSMSRRDVKILAFWALFGIAKARGGSYQKDIKRVLSAVRGMKIIRFKNDELEFGIYLKDAQKEG